jgi:hypothetical protein
MNLTRHTVYVLRRPVKVTPSNGQSRHLEGLSLWVREGTGVRMFCEWCYSEWRRLPFGDPDPQYHVPLKLKKDLR